MPDVAGFASMIHDFQHGPDPFEQRLFEFYKRWPVEVAKVRRQLLEPVPVDGSRERGRQLGYYMDQDRDGQRAYFQRRLDDCLQAAVACLLQIPQWEVPDFHIDRQLLAGKEKEEVERQNARLMREWTRKNALTFYVHSSLPTAGRWAGVVPGGDGKFDHCLIMNGRECVFDTASLLPHGRNEPASKHDPSEIEYGITIERW